MHGRQLAGADRRPNSERPKSERRTEAGGQWVPGQGYRGRYREELGGKPGRGEGLSGKRKGSGWEKLGREGSGGGLMRGALTSPGGASVLNIALVAASGKRPMTAAVTTNKAARPRWITSASFPTTPGSWLERVGQVAVWAVEAVPGVRCASAVGELPDCSGPRVGGLRQCVEWYRISCPSGRRAFDIREGLSVSGNP